MDDLLELCEAILGHPMCQEYAGARYTCLFCQAMDHGEKTEHKPDCPTRKYYEIKARLAARPSELCVPLAMREALESIVREWDILTPRGVAYTLAEITQWLQNFLGPLIDEGRKALSLDNAQPESEGEPETPVKYFAKYGEVYQIMSQDYEGQLEAYRLLRNKFLKVVPGMNLDTEKLKYEHWKADYHMSRIINHDRRSEVEVRLAKSGEEQGDV